jgi:hypothetical protein
MSDIQTKTAEATKEETKEENTPVTDADTQSAVDQPRQEEGGQSDDRPSDQPDAAPPAAEADQDSDTGGNRGAGAGSDEEQPTSSQPAEEPSADLNKVRIVTKALKNIERDIANVIRLLESGSGLPTKETVQVMTSSGATSRMSREESASLNGANSGEGRVIEGVFDGQSMVGSDGKSYTVPANYASKSKLVEGDMLKLTITPRGSFIYKQIGPIERSRVMATLGFDPTIGEYYAADDNRRWNVLKASVTYYRGDPGDEVVLLIPKSAPSKWAAVENIIKNVGLDEGYKQSDSTESQPEGSAPDEVPANEAPAEGQPADSPEESQSDKSW